MDGSDESKMSAHPILSFAICATSKKMSNIPARVSALVSSKNEGGKSQRKIKT